MAKNVGFETNVEQSDPSILSPLPFENLLFSRVELRDLGLTLPIGIFSNSDRFQEFTLHPYNGDIELLLGRLVESNSDREGNVKEPIRILKEFLPHVINTIGGQPLPDLARSLSLSSQRLIEGMYFADVMTLLLAIRLQAQGSEIAMAANCPKCNTLSADNPDKGRGFHDLGSVEVKVMLDLHQKPVFELALPEPFSLFEDTITRLWVEPLKLYQLDRLLKSTTGNPGDLDQIYQMVSGIPESQTYRNVRGQVFNNSIYQALCVSRSGGVSKNKSVLYKAIGKLQAGPVMEVSMDCANPRCRWEWKQGLPWMMFRQFLYFPAEATEE